MSILIASADGDFTGTSTWSYSNFIAYRNEETNQYTVLTAYPVWASVGKFTPGAFEIDGIGIKLAARLGTTGTLTISLQDASGVAVLDGTTCEVTLDIATDVPDCTAADLNGGWLFVKFATPVTPLDETQYGINVKTSNASQIRLWGSSNTLTSISRLVRLTETAAPIAGDNFIITKEWTAAGTGTTRTVTYNETAATDYGSASTSLITPAISICNGGTLQSGTTAATNYVLKVSGNIVVYSGGTLNIGTSGTPVPSGGSSWIEFDCGANVDFGLIVRNLGTFNMYGTKGFSTSPSNHYTLLTADEAAAQTVIGPVQDTTGWEANDEVCFAATTYTQTENEKLTISTVDSSTQFTLSSGLAYAHSGTNDANGDLRCEIGNLTRNVGIRGASITLQAYCVFAATATVTLRKAQFKWLGSATSLKRGFDIQTTTGTFDCQYCGFMEWGVSGSGIAITGTSGGTTTTVVLSHNTMFYIHGGLSVSTTTGTWTIDDNLIVRVYGGTAVTLSDVGGVFTNNRINGSGYSSSSIGIVIQEANGVIGTFSGNEVRATNGNQAIQVMSALGGTLLNCRLYRNNVTNVQQAAFSVQGGSNSAQELVVENLVTFGNNSTNVSIYSGRVRFISPNIQGGSTLGTQIGIKITSGPNTSHTVGLGEVIIENGLIGTVTSHSSADINVAIGGASSRVIMHNTTLGSTNEVTGVSNFGIGGHITSLKHDATAGNHKTWKCGGPNAAVSLELDTAKYHTASPSLKMWPGSTTIKLESSAFHAAVASGNTLTASVRVRCSTTGSGDSASYNGATRPRLVVKRNVAAGITADTVLATATSAADGASNGAFELISGTTAAVTDDAILEFVVDCEGTAGFVHVDDFACTAEDSKSMKFWEGMNQGPNAFGSPLSSVIVIEE